MLEQAFDSGLPVCQARIPEDRTVKLQEAVDLYLVRLRERNSSASHIATVRSRLRFFVSPPAKKRGGAVRERSAVPVRQLTRADVGDYFAALKHLYAEGTVAGHAQTHKAFWKWCRKMGFSRKNLGKKVGSYSFDPVVREAAPLADVLVAVSQLFAFAGHRDNHPVDIRDALFVSLCIDSGGRRGAVLKLRWKDVEGALARPRRAANGRVVYRVVVLRDKTKTKRLRFFSESAELFKMWSAVAPGHQETDSVFLSLWTGKRLSADSTSRAFVRVCGFAGVPVFRSQSLRMLNVSDIVSMTNIDVGQRYAEHSNPATTMTHYLTKKAEQVDDAAAELADKRRGAAAFHNEMAEFFGLFEPDD